jgi:hypothetical protein
LDHREPAERQPHRQNQENGGEGIQRLALACCQEGRAACDIRLPQRNLSLAHRLAQEALPGRVFEQQIGQQRVVGTPTLCSSASDLYGSHWNRLSAGISVRPPSVCGKKKISGMRNSTTANTRSGRMGRSRWRIHYFHRVWFRFDRASVPRLGGCVRERQNFQGQRRMSSEVRIRYFLRRLLINEAFSSTQSLRYLRTVSTSSLAMGVLRVEMRNRCPWTPLLL